MTYIEAVDISQWQGAYKDYGTPIVIMKASGGDAGMYFDSRCYENYAGAKSQGKSVGLYHFAGGGNPEAEADFFLKACAPLEENDVLALDWEIQNPDPVGWCNRFVDRVHAQSGVWPLLYINLATLRTYNWDSVLAKCGLWIAAWTGDPNVDINTGGKAYYVHQWQGSPLDRDAVWLSIAQWNKLGYHANAPAPIPPTPPQPVITTGDVSETKEVPFQQVTITDPAKEVGYKEITQVGVNGVETIVYTVTYTDGVETSRVLKSDTITTEPVNEITTVGSKEPVPPTPDPSQPNIIVVVFVGIFNFFRSLFRRKKDK